MCYLAPRNHHNTLAILFRLPPIIYAHTATLTPPPPFSPQEFTSEPAAVTPSPAHSKLRDMTGETPPAFTAFTFTHDSVLDGQTYRVSDYGGEGAE